MDLSKLLDLLQRDSLYFSRSDLLGDPFEGSIPLPNHLTGNTHIAILHQLQELLANDSGTEDEKKERRQLIEEIREKFPMVKAFGDTPLNEIAKLFGDLSKIRVAFSRQIFVSCWHINEFESAAMWRLYSLSSESVCIQSTYSNLASQLPDKAMVGLVQYIDYNSTPIDAGNLLTPFIHKRQSFNHEHEVRALIWDTKRQNELGLRIGVNVPELVERILVNLSSPPWYKEVVENVVRKYGVACPVVQSALSASPLY